MQTQHRMMIEELSAECHSNRTKDVRPFFKSWLKEQSLTDKAIESNRVRKYNVLDDLIVCWIYSKNFSDIHDVNAAHNIFFSDFQDVRSVTIKPDTPFELINKKRNFDFYMYLKNRIKDGTFFDESFKEKEHYARIHAGQEAEITAEQVGMEF